MRDAIATIINKDQEMQFKMANKLVKEYSGELNASNLASDETDKNDLWTLRFGRGVSTQRIEI